MEHDILTDLMKFSYYEEWYKIVKPIITHPEFQVRKYFKHHDDSVYTHCVVVSFHSFLVAKFYHLDTYHAAVAGLLHDFYPYAWQYSEELENINPKYLERLHQKKRLLSMHGFVHGKEAAENAKKYFSEYVDESILDSITNHMFPLTLRMPKHIEGWIVTCMDKKLSFGVLKNYKKLPKYIGLEVHSNE